MGMTMVEKRKFLAAAKPWQTENGYSWHTNTERAGRLYDNAEHGIVPFTIGKKLHGSVSVPDDVGGEWYATEADAMHDLANALGLEWSEGGSPEAWRHAWRVGVVPSLSLEALQALEAALLTDDVRLVQNTTVETFTLSADDNMLDGVLCGACPLGYCGWIGEGLESAREVAEFFGRMCAVIDKNMGEPAGCRHFTNWVDNTDRDVMRRELLPEVRAAIRDYSLAAA